MHQPTTLLAKTFVINGDGLILILRRSKTDRNRPLTWDLPGGTVDSGEDPTVGAIREAKEEAGLKLENLKVLNVTSFSRDDTYYTRLLYYTYVTDADIKLSYEHDQYKWVSRDEFTKLDIPEVYTDSVALLPN